MAAARTGSLETVRLLLARGADVKAKEGGLGHTALMLAAAAREPCAVVQMLIEAPGPSERPLHGPARQKGRRIFGFFYRSPFFGLALASRSIPRSLAAASRR